MLRRYGGFTPLEHFSFRDISGIIDIACEKAQDELLVLRWIAGGYERNVAFSDFRAACTAVPAVSKSAEQIHTEMSEKFEKFNFVKMGCLIIRRFSVDSLILRTWFIVSA